MQQIVAHWTFKYALLFSWDVTSTIDSVIVIKHNSGMSNHALQHLEAGDYSAVTMLLLSICLSEAWVLYIRANIHYTVGD
jgi:hypothetical protein